ncbi:MAG: hypothetical protein VCB77_02800 [Alphaproteobacteria bacterium]
MATAMDRDIDQMGRLALKPVIGNDHLDLRCRRRNVPGHEEDYGTADYDSGNQG